MGLVILLLCGAAYLWIEQSRHFFVTSCAIGHRSSCNLIYLKNPEFRFYLKTRFILVAAIIFLPTLFGEFFSYGLFFWLVLQLICGFTGRNKAYQNHRRIYGMMAEREEDEEKREQYEEEAKKTNKEIASRAKALKIKLPFGVFSTYF